MSEIGGPKEVPTACALAMLMGKGMKLVMLRMLFFPGEAEMFSILLLAADFWVVKNVTGRLLVGLRW